MKFEITESIRVAIEMKHVTGGIVSKNKMMLIVVVNMKRIMF